MQSKKRRLKKSKLYLILDAQVNSYQELFEIATIAIREGVDILQLRDKSGSARDILTFCKKVQRVLRSETLFILNDRVDLSILTQSDGVHVGQGDIPLQDAQSLLPKKLIVGVSCQTYAHVKKAEQGFADYIGLGSIFKTLTKPDRHPMNVQLLKKVYRNAKLPVFAIGGIDLPKCEQLKKVGVDRVAVCRAICLARNKTKVIKEFQKILDI